MSCHYNLWAIEIWLQIKKGIRSLNLRHFISFQSPDFDLKYHMLSITLNNPNFYSKNNHYLNFITGQDKFSFNLSAISNFRNPTFSLWWIYSGWLIHLNIPPLLVLVFCMCVCVCECTQASICLKNCKIFIYIMDIFLQWCHFF